MYSRCRELFPTTDELRAHMLLPVDKLCKPMISIPPRDSDDGITPEIEDVLNGRKMGLKIAAWGDLWRLLFPEDNLIPNAGGSPACLRYFVPSSPADYQETLNHPSSILSCEISLKTGFPS